MSNRSEQEVRDAINKAEDEITSLMAELGEIISKDPNASRRLYLQDCGFRYITESDKSWADRYGNGYGVGDWMPSAGTC
jgi:hypothetical protein